LKRKWFITEVAGKNKADLSGYTGRKEIKMYTVYDAKGIPYETVWDEIEADYIAYYIGGYYESNGRTVYV
jgi:hypothetical protein